MSYKEIQQMDLFDELPAVESGEEKITQRALDDLFHGARKFRTSQSYRDLIDFIVRFRFYSPYNAMLIHIQMPGATFVATPKRWDKKYGRRIKENSRPLVILQPKGPIMFVFDVVDTEPGFNPKPLPPEVQYPFRVRYGRIGSEFERIIENAKRDGVQILMHHEGSQRGGSIQPVYDEPPRFMELRPDKTPQGKKIMVPVRYIILLNDTLSRESKFATIVHELGHLYCGHLGTPNVNWWPDRRGLQYNVGEFEAESVSYLVCSRLDIHTPSDEYLAGYLDKNLEIPSISLESVMKAAGLIEQMIQKHLKPRKSKEE